ncbi:MAG: orotidine-5'-phosphate decarboxylase [Oleiphilaceae bacterium]|nr:orotidine-5'-phosphate decarboxylase [Oleiphilaceae bacterium]
MQSHSSNESLPVIVALDFSDASSALALADRLDPKQCRVKVGKELFTRSGPPVVEQLQAKGFDVFLDLKFHDIPNTTSKAVAAAADLGVWMVNVHASGGRAMMEACANELAQRQQRPLLIGVTVLTSMQQEDLRDIGLDIAPIEQVERLASLTKDCGLDGVVCSSHETAQLKRALGDDFCLVTPGIRPAFAAKGDQKRIMSPREALEAGSDYLVIGRPITQHAEPMEALAMIADELRGV